VSLPDECVAVLEKRADARVGADEEARQPVEKPTPDQIIAYESPPRANEEVDVTDASAAMPDVVSTPPRILHHFADVMRKITKRLMVNWLLDITHVGDRLESLMDIARGVPAVAGEETHMPVASIWTVLQLLPEKEVAESNAIGRMSRRAPSDDGLDSPTELVSHPLVGVERVKLVVHDWGAGALVFAQAHPERVERLILCNAVPLLPDYRWHWIARVWRRRLVGELAMGLTTRWSMERLLRPAFVGPVPRGFVDAAWSHFDQGTQRAILRLYRSAPEGLLAAAGRELSHIRVPALVVCGTRDPYIPPQFADAYAARLPQARVEHLEDTGHWPWLDCPDVVQRFATFLEES